MSNKSYSDFHVSNARFIPDRYTKRPGLTRIDYISLVFFYFYCRGVEKDTKINFCKKIQ